VNDGFAQMIHEVQIMPADQSQKTLVLAAWIQETFGELGL
jgi:hypothetical protein